MDEIYITSKEAREILKTNANNLRQIVKKGQLTKQGLAGRYSTFLASEVETLRIKRLTRKSAVETGSE